MQRSYETVVVIDPSIGDQEVEQQIEKLTQLVAQDEGQVTEVQRWGRRKIAYEIRGKGEGYFAMLRFTAKPAQIPALERACRLNESILRHLVLKASD
jgi:small subunit ribosomal protein S6